ncbi:MAG TPA: acyl-CoA dehydrogenase [Acidimicrobiia bacterium]|nr:acyl-CoA dehydrogenase [Acidimicrobiia bacterium]
MNGYQPPLDDIDFALARHARLAGRPAPWSEPEAVAALLAEAGRFIVDVVAPLNRIGDRQGCRLAGDAVTTPDGFRDAYRRFARGGWGSLDVDPAHGGGGAPTAVAVAVEEMLTAANVAFSLCPMLTHGAVELLTRHGGPEHRPFLERLVTGEWTGTMCLTEPDAGSDLGAVRTAAVPRPDGTWLVRGTKVFITYGEHDLADNIVHLVLARTPGAPPGTKGVSCLLVPKFLPDEAGRPGRRNDVRCVGIEHKLGIHGSPTCSLSFGEGGGAVGYLVGDVSQGLPAMFTMMNRSRLSIGVEGLGLAERAFQLAQAYAENRRQGRALGGERGAPGPSPIIDHPDVRRMLLTMKAYVAAMRGLVYETAAWLDRSRGGDERERAADRLALLTPIVKAWCSDRAVEIASLGVQVHGGAGYIEETGAAQLLRDARITPIYEGTNGIQADDLVRRKLGRSEGTAIVEAIADVAAVAERALADGGPVLDGIGQQLRESVQDTFAATTHLLSAAPRAQAAAASEYLELLGLLFGGGAVARGALAGAAADRPGPRPGGLSVSPSIVARFYAAHLLPRTGALARSIVAGDDALFGGASRRPRSGVVGSPGPRRAGRPPQREGPWPAVAGPAHP